MASDVHVPAHPFMVGETIPGYCGGRFPLETYDQELRVEAVGVDWVVLRGEDGEPHFHCGSHDELRTDAQFQRYDDTRRRNE